MQVKSLTRCYFGANTINKPILTDVFFYFNRDTRRCFRYLAFWGTKNYVVFIGDTRIRLLYQSFLQHLEPHVEDNASRLSGDQQSSSEFVDYKLRLRVNYIYTNEVANTMVNEFAKWASSDKTPSAVIASCTHSGFFKGNVTEDIISNFSANLTRLVRPIDDLIKKKSKVLWKLQDYINVDDKELDDEWKNIRNSDIDKFNQAITDILGYSDVHIWSSSKLIANGLSSELKNGWRLSPLALQHDIQLLLNMFCNDYMNYNDGSCCNSAETYTTLQAVTYAVFGVW